MKRVIVLVSALLFFSVANSQDIRANCEQDSSSATCQAYISGLVEGYIASKQKYIAKQPDYESDFATRVYASRVNSARVSSLKASPACLPDNVDSDEIADQLEQALPSQDLTKELGEYLQQRFPCE
ncbi:hypothetical protein LP316_12350 [Thalassotalea sp. LPB0316]|uniref:hypothetical protein n=1 Tax=Thalassotalea sp. LPB0316 TaxID=2769490 RepID=UPI001869585C|nr:hypothetical protein [Thalassotalea sp. LPB0316]QOL25086.1 hypothetical protein LP316_12350 [Thalassotalea sp. LPB0316]